MIAAATHYLHSFFRIRGNRGVTSLPASATGRLGACAETAPLCDNPNNKFGTAYYSRAMLVGRMFVPEVAQQCNFDACYVYTVGVHHVTEFPEAPHVSSIYHPKPAFQKSGIF